MRKTDGPINPTGGYREDPEGGYPFDYGVIWLGALMFVCVSMAALVVGWAWNEVPGMVIVYAFVGLPSWFIAEFRLSKAIMEGELDGDVDRVRRAKRNHWIICGMAGLLIAYTLS